MSIAVASPASHLGGRDRQVMALHLERLSAHHEAVEIARILDAPRTGGTLKHSSLWDTVRA